MPLKIRNVILTFIQPSKAGFNFLCSSMQKKAKHVKSVKIGASLFVLTLVWYLPFVLTILVGWRISRYFFYFAYINNFANFFVYFWIDENFRNAVLCR